MLATLLSFFILTSRVFWCLGYLRKEGIDPVQSSLAQDFKVIEPVFTDPRAKVILLKNHTFSERLYAQAIALEPILGMLGTQVHLGFWSGIRSTGSNHGSLVRLLDSINSFNSDPTMIGPQLVQRAIWDEGVSSSNQYPLYVKQINEFWYERTTIPIVIRGRQYPKVHFVDFAMADLIWGLYSQRYADMAALIHRQTGRVPRAWCFVSGAKVNRIFYAYELPELIALEAAGDVAVYFAFTQEASWTSLTDWALGTAMAPKPLPVAGVEGAGSSGEGGVTVRRLSMTMSASELQQQQLKQSQPLHHYYRYGPDDAYDDDDDDTDVIGADWRWLVRQRELLKRRYKQHGPGKLLFDAVAVANLVRSISSGGGSNMTETEQGVEAYRSFAVDLLMQYNLAFNAEECSRAFTIALESTV